MNILGILDLVIGLFFIYFVFSVICTSIVEGFAQVKQWRCREMNQWVKDTFATIYSKASVQTEEWHSPQPEQDVTLGEAILKHHLIRGLTRNGREADYIPAHVFSSTLFDLIYTKFQEKEKDAGLPDFYYADALKEALQSNYKLLPEELRKYLLQALHESRNAGDGIDFVKRRFENWFNDAMERVIGTYKKKTRSWTWVIAFTVAIAANVDTISLSKYLKDNSDTVGRKIVEAARQATQDSLLYHEAMRNMAKADSLLTASGNQAPTQRALMDSTLAKIERSKERSLALIKSLSEMGLPLGWEQDGEILCKFFWPEKDGDKDKKQQEQTSKDKTTPSDPGWGWFLRKLLGIALSALALTVGAPFWFDTINKLVNIRSAGNKPEDISSDKPVIHG